MVEQSSPDIAQLVEKEAKRRCEEAGMPLDRLACQDHRFRHDDRRPWWQAIYSSQVEREIERLQTAGFAISAARSSAAIDRTPAAVIRLLTKIANLVDDEDACEPLDDAIRYANEAIALINDPAQPKPDPRLTDNDAGEISVTVDGKEVRGWSYKDDTERRTKMLAAREYVEGWCDGRDA